MATIEDPFGLLGTTVAGKYRVETVAAEGGFSVLYRAHHLDFDAPVALKALRLDPGLAGAERDVVLSAFEIEGKLLFSLCRKHPAFVQVTDRGVLALAGREVVPYLVMEWLEGVSLHGELARARSAGEPRWPLARLLAFMRPIADALEVAHSAGVVHRDIKPANIFVVPDAEAVRARLLDLGIAKIMSSTGPAAFRDPTRPGFLRGFTPPYAAPEQWLPRYGATGPWTDVFALALVCVELLTGARALSGDEPGALMRAATATARPTPRARGADVSPSVDAVFGQALAVEPRDRFPSAGAFWRALVGAAARPQQAHAPPSTRTDVHDRPSTEPRPPASPRASAARNLVPSGPTSPFAGAPPAPRQRASAPRGSLLGAGSSRQIATAAAVAGAVAFGVGLLVIALTRPGSTEAAGTSRASVTTGAPSRSTTATVPLPGSATPEPTAPPRTGAPDLPTPVALDPASSLPPTPRLDEAARRACCVTEITHKDICGGGPNCPNGVAWASAAPCAELIPRDGLFRLTPVRLNRNAVTLFTAPAFVCLPTGALAGHFAGQEQCSKVGDGANPLVVTGAAILSEGLDVTVRDRPGGRVLGQIRKATRPDLQRGAMCQGMQLAGLSGPEVTAVVFEMAPVP